MATAGRVLIIPKGKYNAETQYGSLDMVSHGGKGWICKKTCIGIEPAEGDYWAECIDVSEELKSFALESSTMVYRGETPSDADLETLDIGVWFAKSGNSTYGIPNTSMIYKPIDTSLSGSYVVCFSQTVNYGIYVLNNTTNKYEKLAFSGDVSPIKTITATSASNGVVLVANSANGDTPLSVVCDTDGYYVGRLFKNQHGLWYATIFDVATIQAVTSETEVTLYATMKPK